MLEYQLNPNLIRFRNNIIESLRSHSCTIPNEVAENYSPHMTLVLGKTLDNESKQKASDIFAKNSGVHFTHWKLLRYDETDNTKVKILDGARL